MSLTQEVVLFIITFLVFGAIDLTWFGYIAKVRYNRSLKKFFAKKFELAKAIPFLAVQALGLTMFVLVPAVNGSSLGFAMLWGAQFGFFTFATFNSKAWGMISKWPLKISLQDTLWGVFAGFTTATISYSIYVSIFPN